MRCYGYECDHCIKVNVRIIPKLQNWIENMLFFENMHISVILPKKKKELRAKSTNFWDNPRSILLIYNIYNTNTGNIHHKERTFICCIALKTVIFYSLVLLSFRVSPFPPMSDVLLTSIIVSTNLQRTITFLTTVYLKQYIYFVSTRLV